MSEIPVMNMANDRHDFHFTLTQILCAQSKLYIQVAHEHWISQLTNELNLAICNTYVVDVSSQGFNVLADDLGINHAYLQAEQNLPHHIPGMHRLNQSQCKCPSEADFLAKTVVDDTVLPMMLNHYFKFIRIRFTPLLCA